MERTELFDLMGELQLHGMKAAFDEIMATAVKRQHEPATRFFTVLDTNTSLARASAATRAPM